MKEQQAHEDDWLSRSVPASETPAPADDWMARSVVAQEPVSNVESFARGAAQSGTMGFADEMAGGAEALWEKAKGNPAEFGKLYEKHRNESRKNYEAAQKENPGSFGTGSFIGSIPLAPVPAPIQGAITGLGEAHTSNPKELAAQSAVGAASGLIGGKVGQFIGSKIGNRIDSEATRNALNTVYEGLKKNAERMAARTLGAERGTIKKIGEEKVLQAGRHALDEGIIDEGLKTGKNPMNWIFPGAATEAMIEKNKSLQQAAGKGMDKVYDAIDSQDASIFNPEVAARIFEDRKGDFWRSPINKSETKQFENVLEAIRMRGNGNIPIREAQKLKEEIGNTVNWNNKLNPTEKEKMSKEAYGIVKEMIDKSVEHSANKMHPSLGTNGTNPLSQELRDSLKGYANASKAEQLLENRQAREQGNKLIGLTDTIAGATAGTVINPVTGLATVAAKKGIEQYGPASLAKLSDSLANVAKNSPEKLGQFRKTLENAFQRGGRSAAITHYLLQQQNPEYQELMKSLNENSEDEK